MTCYNINYEKLTKEIKKQLKPMLDKSGLLYIDNIADALTNDFDPTRCYPGEYTITVPARYTKYKTEQTIDISNNCVNAFEDEEYESIAEEELKKLCK